LLNILTVRGGNVKKGPPAQESNDRYRELLLAKRARVLSGLGSKFDTLARLGRVAEDDQAQISHDEFISLKMNNLDYSQLRLSQEALDRLEAGDYGICLACEEAIAPKRLLAVPWARYCIKCQDTAGLEMDREITDNPARLLVSAK
jgi:DnaK suppressor protein